MTIPNFFIVGAPKCGTTAWVEYLAGHPDIHFSRLKEPHYFSTDFPGFTWARTPEDYASLFRDAGNARIVGEASVMYLYSSDAARNIHRYNPLAKVLIFLRDQTTFLPSYHNQLLYNRDEVIADFPKVWRMARDGAERSIPATCRETSFLNYLDVGRFDDQVRRYLDVFEPRQIMVLRYETWTRDPRSAYLSVIDFLGLADDGRVDFGAVHQAKRHRSAAVARLTQRPPRIITIVARLLRSVLGRDRLGLAQRIRKANSGEGYASPVPDILRAEIAEFYKTGNCRLDNLLRESGVRLA